VICRHRGVSYAPHDPTNKQCQKEIDAAGDVYIPEGILDQGLELFPLTFVKSQTNSRGPHERVANDEHLVYPALKGVPETGRSFGPLVLAVKRDRLVGLVDGPVEVEAFVVVGFVSGHVLAETLIAFLIMEKRISKVVR
jgi:hypothetical protein